MAPNPRRWSITTALSGGFSALIFVALVSGLYFAFDTGYRNTQVLVSDKAVLIVESVTNHVRQHLLPVAEQIEYLVALIDEGRLDPRDPKQLQSQLAAALAATPQVNAIIYIDKDFKASRMLRAAHRKLDVLDWSNLPYVTEGVKQLRNIEGVYWGEIVYVPRISSSVVNVRISVSKNGEYLGALVASVRFEDLSQYITRINARHDAIAFVLLGQNQVLAHPNLVNGYRGLSSDQPLPLLKTFDDEILRHIWDERFNRPVAANQLHQGYGAHVSERGDVNYIFVYEELPGFGELTWTVGCYFRASSIGAAFGRLRFAYWVGVAILLFSVGVTLYVGYKISKPIRRLAIMANEINEHGLEKVRNLPPSRLIELNSAASAFNNMVEGLRDRELMRKTFGRYVPESVAGSILQDKGILKPQKRNATIMFTDIIGFSTLSETMSPEGLIATLNEYFSILIKSVENYGGVIHQFQGDAILATFNLPAEDPDHAANAVRTALAIQEVSSRHKLSGGVEMATRIGINTGLAVCGTVGAGERLGFTVHGDEVNLAARVEQLNKTYGTRVLVTQSTVDCAGSEFQFKAIGEVPIRGRKQTAVVYRVKGAHSEFETIEKP